LQGWLSLDCPTVYVFLGAILFPGPPRRTSESISVPDRRRERRDRAGL